MHDRNTVQSRRGPQGEDHRVPARREIRGTPEAERAIACVIISWAARYRQ